MIGWTDEDSANLTAVLIVVDNVRMPVPELDTEELKATLLLAHKLQVPRSVIAERIGWSKDSLYRWAVKHDCAPPEADFDAGPLAWCTKKFNETHPVSARQRPKMRRG
jgi:hypothetical protein